jgi:hypothetical protein
LAAMLVVGEEPRQALGPKAGGAYRPSQHQVELAE